MEQTLMQQAINSEVDLENLVRVAFNFAYVDFYDDVRVVVNSACSNLIQVTMRKFLNFFEYKGDFYTSFPSDKEMWSIESRLYAVESYFANHILTEYPKLREIADLDMVNYKTKYEKELLDWMLDRFEDTDLDDVVDYAFMGYCCNDIINDLNGQLKIIKSFNKGKNDLEDMQKYNEDIIQSARINFKHRHDVDNSVFRYAPPQKYVEEFEIKCVLLSNIFIKLMKEGIELIPSRKDMQEGFKIDRKFIRQLKAENWGTVPVK